jgi:mannose-6-phosphate isomerase-like protein (cupin superfamily)
MNELDSIELGKVCERPWGRWVVLEFGDNYRVKRFEVDLGKRFSLQHHNFRVETWLVVSGKFMITLDEKQFEAVPGDLIEVALKVKHRAEGLADGTNAIIEIWRGDKLSEDDIVRYEDDYGRK